MSGASRNPRQDLFRVRCLDRGAWTPSEMSPEDTAGNVSRPRKRGVGSKQALLRSLFSIPLRPLDPVLDSSPQTSRRRRIEAAVRVGSTRTRRIPRSGCFMFRRDSLSRVKEGDHSTRTGHQRTMNLSVDCKRWTETGFVRRWMTPVETRWDRDSAEISEGRIVPVTIG